MPSDQCLLLQSCPYFPPEYSLSKNVVSSAASSQCLAILWSQLGNWRRRFSPLASFAVGWFRRVTAVDSTIQEKCSHQSLTVRAWNSLVLQWDIQWETPLMHAPLTCALGQSRWPPWASPDCSLPPPGTEPGTKFGSLTSVEKSRGSQCPELHACSAAEWARPRRGDSSGGC